MRDDLSSECWCLPQVLCLLRKNWKEYSAYFISSAWYFTGIFWGKKGIYVLACYISYLYQNVMHHMSELLLKDFEVPPLKCKHESTSTYTICTKCLLTAWVCSRNAQAWEAYWSLEGGQYSRSEFTKWTAAVPRTNTTLVIKENMLILAESYLVECNSVEWIPPLGYLDSCLWPYCVCVCACVRAERTSTFLQVRGTGRRCHGDRDVRIPLVLLRAQLDPPLLDQDLTTTVPAQGPIRGWLMEVRIIHHQHAYGVTCNILYRKFFWNTVLYSGALDGEWVGQYSDPTVTAWPRPP